MAITLSLTTHFTVTVDDDDNHTITGGSTTAADTVTLGSEAYFDQRFIIGATTLQELWSDSNATGNFDFLWIEANGGVELQFVCNEGGTLSGNNIENGWVVKLAAGIPYILANDDSRNMGNMAGTFNETNHQSEIDTWETNWAADTIDRIECYNPTAGNLEVRIFVGT